MENATEALKMAFAVLVLAIAITVSIKVFSQARQTSDVVLRKADETLYYDYEQYTKSGKAGENRIVGMETLIPTLYKYSKENYRIVFQQGTYNASTGELKDVKPLEIYETTSNKDYWSKSYKGYEEEGKTVEGSYSYKLNNGGTDISVFDVTEEEGRNEPWTGSTITSENESTGNEYTKHLKSLLSGGHYDLMAYSEHSTKGTYIDYGGGTYNFFYQNKDKLDKLKFIEEIGKIKAEKKGNITTTKKVITYVLISN